MKLYKDKNGNLYKISSIQKPKNDWILATEEDIDKYMIDGAKPQVPGVVSRAQAKAALIMAGLWDTVLTAVESIEDPTNKALAEVAIEDTNDWMRDSPMLNQLASELGLTQEDLDDLFIQAHNIKL